MITDIYYSTYIFLYTFIEEQMKNKWRSKNISVIYLTQSCTSVDIKTIRNNLTVLIMFNLVSVFSLNFLLQFFVGSFFYI